MKKVLCFIMVLCLSFSLFACSSSRINAVKNGELSDYPDKPIAKTVRKSFKDWDYVILEEEWTDASEDDDIEDGFAYIKSSYELDDDGTIYDIEIAYFHNIEYDSISVFYIEVDGDRIYYDDDDDIASYLDQLFE